LMIIIIITWSDNLLKDRNWNLLIYVGVGEEHMNSLTG